jgi:glycosyltransferase involved in cell wall biosynthesis
MKIFGTVFPYFENKEESYKEGRHVANFEFLKALLLHGSYDEYHFYCLSVPNLEFTMKRVEKLGLPQLQQSRICFCLVNQLTSGIRDTAYHVFHLGGWGYFFPGLAYIRNNHAKNLFPITGLIHSLNGVETPYHALKVCLAPLMPFDTIVCSSEAGKKVIEGTFGRLSSLLSANVNGVNYAGGLEVIPLGVDDSMLQNVGREDARHRLGLPADAFVLLSVGRMTPTTKMDAYPLLQVTQQLVSANSGRIIRLLLAGGASPSYVKTMQAMIAELHLTDVVKIIPDFDNDDKVRIYRAADVAVSLSDNLQETFGLSVIEAMACGIPVVASDFDGYKELVVEGSTGFRIPTTWTGNFPAAELADIMNFDTMQLILAQCLALDAEALQGKLQQLIDDPALGKTLGENGRARATAQYRWSTIIKDYERLWDRLHDEAAAYKGEIRRGDNALMNDYLSVFKHYPTATLGPSTRVAATSLGTHAMKNRWMPARYGDVGPYVDEKLVAIVVKKVVQKPCEFAELQRELKAESADGRLDFTVLWMAKYGLVTLR